MKRFIILIFIAGLLFAIKPVPRNKKRESDDGSNIKLENVVKEKTRKQDKITDKEDKDKKDVFQDADSDGVNDQREDDFQKIKWLKTKIMDLFKKKEADKKEETEKPKVPSKKKYK